MALIKTDERRDAARGSGYFPTKLYPSVSTLKLALYPANFGLQAAVGKSLSYGPPRILPEKS